MKGVGIVLSLAIIITLNIGIVTGQCYLRPTPCELTCRCGARSDIDCVSEHINGCGEHGCRKGWSGPTCQRENILYRMHSWEESQYNFTLKSSIPEDAFDVQYVFDGNLSTSFRAEDVASPFIQIFIGHVSGLKVHFMKLFNREDDPDATAGFHIFVSNTSDFINSKLCYQDNSTIGKAEYDITCDQRIEAKYVRLTVPKATSLVIRELEIYHCAFFWFGEKCDRVCNCENGLEVCDRLTGSCGVNSGGRGQCAPGYHGTDCYKECDVGSYGPGCQGECHCKIETSCNRINGSCDQQGCAEGYNGTTCQQKCGRGFFGYKCKEKCHCQNNWDCSKINGTCIGDHNRCQLGYMGWNCQEACPNERYGDNCETECRCKNRKNCRSSAVSVYCGENGCVDGYLGYRCETECNPGWFGKRCLRLCHCKNPISCNHTNGHCDQAGCAPGYTGKACQHKCPSGYYGDGCRKQCHCFATEQCDPVSGSCGGDCAPGYYDTPCRECRAGWFGARCTQLCHCKNQASCNKVTGSCDEQGCAAGYTGDDCQHTCTRGRFGEGCQQICHCYNPTSCDRTNGACDSRGCLPGYGGYSCRECLTGKFGKECRGSCHCKNQTACNHVDGSCDQQGCATGYSGESCQTGDDSITGSAKNDKMIGGYLAGIILLVIVVVAIIIYSVIATIKCRQYQRGTEEETNSRYAVFKNETTNGNADGTCGSIEFAK